MEQSALASAAFMRASQVAPSVVANLNHLPPPLVDATRNRVAQTRSGGRRAAGRPLARVWPDGGARDAAADRAAAAPLSR